MKQCETDCAEQIEKSELYRIACSIFCENSIDVKMGGLLIRRPHVGNSRIHVSPSQQCVYYSDKRLSPEVARLLSCYKEAGLEFQVRYAVK